jgi:hypothetical protein
MIELFEREIKSVKEKIEMIDKGVKIYAPYENIENQKEWWEGVKEGLEIGLMGLEYLKRRYEIEHNTALERRVYEI